MTQESSLIYSPLQQTVQENGRSAEIHIYRSLDSLWILEVVQRALSVRQRKEVQEMLRLCRRVALIQLLAASR